MEKMKCAQCGATIFAQKGQRLVICAQCGARNSIARERRTLSARTKKYLLRGGLIAAGAALLVLLTVGALIPQLNYSLATRRQAAGDYAGAKSALRAAGRYLDSAERLNELVLAHPAKGDVFLFGAWEQDGDTANGAEPLSWRVLTVEDGRALIITEKIIDAVQYDRMSRSMDWENSNLRRWMNGDFLDGAFSAEEQARIAESHLINADNPDYGIEGGADTTDRVFALSLEEAARTMGGKNVAAPITRWARKHGALIGLETETGWWWLRSPGFSTEFASVVTGRGELFSIGVYVNNADIGVRPALWLDAPEA